MNQKSSDPQKNFSPGTWRGAGTRHTLLLAMAQDAEKLAAQAARIKELRSFSRESQEAVAHAIDVTVRAYQRWERGEGDIGPENLKNLASYFGTTPDFIEYGTMKQHTPDFLPKEPEDVGERLRALEELVSHQDEQLRQLAEMATRDAEALQRIEEALRPKRSRS